MTKEVLLAYTLLEATAFYMKQLAMTKIVLFFCTVYLAINLRLYKSGCLAASIMSVTIRHFIHYFKEVSYSAGKRKYFTTCSSKFLNQPSYVLLLWFVDTGK